jgi:hypothetical protein
MIGEQKYFAEQTSLVSLNDIIVFKWRQYLSAKNNNALRFGI